MVFTSMVFSFPDHRGWIEHGLTFTGGAIHKVLVLRVNIRTNAIEYVVRKNGRKVGASHETYESALKAYNKIFK